LPNDKSGLASRWLTNPEQRRIGQRSNMSAYNLQIPPANGKQRHVALANKNEAKFDQVLYSTVRADNIMKRSRARIFLRGYMII
jgi:hypothetical protein